MRSEVLAIQVEAAARAAGLAVVSSETGNEDDDSGTTKFLLALAGDAAPKDEYLFGPDFLVAPVIDEGTQRAVYLPAGEWVDYWTGAEIAGCLLYTSRCV